MHARSEIQQSEKRLATRLLQFCDSVLHCSPVGTTWTQHIVNLIRNQGKDDTSGLHITMAVPWIESTLPVEILIEDLDKMPSPRFFKSHNPYNMMAGGLPHTTPAKYIYIARNPKDVAVSYYYHMHMFNPLKYSGTWDEFYQLYKSGKVYFGDWFDHVLEWWKHRDAENILFLKYEDMKKDHCGMVKKMAQFMGYNLEEEVIDTIVEKSTFQSMKGNPAIDPDKIKMPVPVIKPDAQPFLRKGIVGDWKNHFTPEQNAEYDEIYVKKMKDSGLDFDF